MIRILMVGDVNGKPGVDTLKRLLPGLLRAEKIDFCIVNGENAEQGMGLLPAQAQEIFHAGADVITGGNHTLYREKTHGLVDQDSRVLRPFNLPEGAPGAGVGIYDLRGSSRVAVLNLMGRVFMMPTDDPFRLGKRELEELQEETPLIVVDFHAEASAEKIAFSRYVDGMCTAVVGTHTHVQTADEQILPGGTAFITDVGMTGSHAGVIGMKTEAALHRFLYPAMGNKSGVAEGEEKLHAVVIDADERTGKASAIRRVQV